MKNVLTIAILAAGACLAADKITPINAKTGLWEVTTVSEQSGSIPIPAETLAKLTPEQRARIEAQFKARSTPQTETKQSCITSEDIAKGLGWDNPDKACHQTMVRSSSTAQEFTWDCSGKGKNAGSMKIEALDSEHVKGYMQVSVGEDGREMNVKATITGKWLSNSCGNVKPTHHP